MGPPHVRGGDPLDGDGCFLVCLASMGPPHVRGGDWPKCEVGRFQCPCFNGAAACSRRRRCIGAGMRSGRRMLQWGRRMFAAETSEPPGRWRLGRWASMGPPHVRGGDPIAATLERPCAVCASMGPPHVRGGDQTPRSRLRGAGRGFNGAAACSRRRRVVFPVGCVRRHRRFNGAAACSRRRLHALRHRGPLLALASMGPPHVRGGD